LIVEDDAELRGLMVALLEDFGGVGLKHFCRLIRKHQRHVSATKLEVEPFLFPF
jgi:hypothetical protein